MNHHKFKFLIKFNNDGNSILIKNHINNCCDPLYSNVIKILSLNLHSKNYIYLELEILDYGVPQIGIDLTSNIIKNIFTKDLSLIIDHMVMFSHIDNDNNVSISWDYLNNKPIINNVNDSDFL